MEVFTGHTCLSHTTRINHTKRALCLNPTKHESNPLSVWVRRAHKIHIHSIHAEKNHTVSPLSFAHSTRATRIDGAGQGWAHDGWCRASLKMHASAGVLRPLVASVGCDQVSELLFLRVGDAYISTLTTPIKGGSYVPRGSCIHSYQ